MKSKLSLIFFLLLSYSGYSNILPVPSVFPTIQQALNVSQPYDTVLVAPGTYNENIIWPAVNAIRLIGIEGADSTIITAGGVGRCLLVNSNGIDTLTIIKGFTLTGGYFDTGNNHGAGAMILNGSVLFEDIIITGNTIFRPGGNVQGVGLHLANSSTVMRNSVISGNKIDSAQWCYGAGVFIFGGSPQFIKVIISQNEAHSSSWCYGVGIYARNITNGVFKQTEVINNFSGNDAIWYYGNGIYAFDVDALFENVLIASNVSGSGGNLNYGGGIFCDGPNGNIRLMNVTVADNRKSNNTLIIGSGIYVRDAAIEIINSIVYNPNSGNEFASNSVAVSVVNFSNVRGGFIGNSNIDTLPEFISSTDFHLSPTSPCAGAGTDQGSPSIDLDDEIRPLPSGTMPDLGCYEVNQPITNIFEITNSSQHIFVYPNPVKKGSTVTILGVSNRNLIMIDTHGRILKSFQVDGDKFELSTEGWAAGLYFVKNGESIPVKFLVLE